MPSFPAPAHERLGADDDEADKIDGNQRYSWIKEPTIMVRQPDATRQRPPQDHQLMSKRRVLGKARHNLDLNGEAGKVSTKQRSPIIPPA